MESYVKKAQQGLMAEADPALIGKRLSLLENIEDMSQAALAKKAGIASNAWNNYVHGRKRIGIENAIRVVATYDLTLDYIYLGDSSNLPPHLQVAIASLMQQRAHRKSEEAKRALAEKVSNK